jgi:hypothetical protein
MHEDMKSDFGNVEVKGYSESAIVKASVLCTLTK